MYGMAKRDMLTGHGTNNGEGETSSDSTGIDAGIRCDLILNPSVEIDASDSCFPSLGRRYEYGIQWIEPYPRMCFLKAPIGFQLLLRIMLELGNGGSQWCHRKGLHWRLNEIQQTFTEDECFNCARKMSMLCKADFWK
jgi:hypothetical protein